MFFLRSKSLYIFIATVLVLNHGMSLHGKSSDTLHEDIYNLYYNNIDYSDRYILSLDGKNKLFKDKYRKINGFIKKKGNIFYLNKPLIEIDQKPKKKIKFRLGSDVKIIENSDILDINYLFINHYYNKIVNHNKKNNSMLANLGIKVDYDYYKNKVIKSLEKKKDLKLYKDIFKHYPNFQDKLEKYLIYKFVFDYIPLVSPVKNARVSSRYGIRKDPFHGKKRMHGGIDFAAPTGTPVYSPASGKVIFTGWMRGYGKVIKIAHTNKIVTLYAHLSKIIVKKGQFVHKLDKIGKIGSTGRSTGPHLHYEIVKNSKKINPELFIIY